MDPNQAQQVQQPINQTPVNQASVNPMTGNPTPQSQPVIPQKSGSKNVVLLLIIFIFIFLGVLGYIFMPFIKMKITAVPTVTPIQRTLAPTTVLPGTSVDEVQNVDLGNIDTDLNSINQDLQQL